MSEVEQLWVVTGARSERAEERGGGSPEELMELPGATPTLPPYPLHLTGSGPTDVSAPTPRDSRVILKGELRPLGGVRLLTTSVYQHSSHSHVTIMSICVTGTPSKGFDEKAYLSAKQLKAGEDPYRQHAFNQLESDKLSPDRPIRDTRHYSCPSVSYSSDLPATSVIITFHNEARSTLLRTVKSMEPRRCRKDEPCPEKLTLVNQGQEDPRSPTVRGMRQSNTRLGVQDKGRNAGIRSRGRQG
ncbi:hypothetical protein P7K49_018248 [Saguinus oedipus]|uniref:Uncharacterized protein n=1 Tax=Saguinus oedipus TaxID=9490 RepID=A0ABQ9V7M1_SAGOE|nr:hypothetical protein P7K49_018248 [Saguinus oedipus]